MAQIIVLGHDTAVRANIITARTHAREVDGISKALLVEQLKKKPHPEPLRPISYFRICAISVSF